MVYPLVRGERNPQQIVNAILDLQANQGRLSSQGQIIAAGSTQMDATAITLASVQVVAASTTNGVRLMVAVPGLIVAMNGGDGGAASFNVYPNGTDQINGGAAGAPFTFTPNPSTSPTLFLCFVAGSWWTK